MTAGALTFGRHGLNYPRGGLPKPAYQATQMEEKRPGTAPRRSLVYQIGLLSPSHPRQILQGLTHAGPDYPSPAWVSPAT